MSVSDGYFTDGRAFFSEVECLLPGFRQNWVDVYTLHSSGSQEVTRCYTTYSALHSLETNKISFCQAMYKDSCSDCSRIILPRVFPPRFSWVLQADPAFMFVKHLQRNPPQPRSCSPLTCGSSVSQAREWESSLITGCTCKSTVLHTAKTGLLPRTKGWCTVFVWDKSLQTLLLSFSPLMIN